MIRMHDAAHANVHNEVVHIGSDCHSDHPWPHISPQRFERFSSVSSVSQSFLKRFFDGRRADYGVSYFDLFLILTLILLESKNLNFKLLGYPGTYSRSSYY